MSRATYVVKKKKPETVHKIYDWTKQDATRCVDCGGPWSTYTFPETWRVCFSNPAKEGDGYNCSPAWPFDSKQEAMAWVDQITDLTAGELLA